MCENIWAQDSRNAYRSDLAYQVEIALSDPLWEILLAVPKTPGSVSEVARVPLIFLLQI